MCRCTCVLQHIGVVSHMNTCPHVQNMHMFLSQSRSGGVFVLDLPPLLTSLLTELLGQSILENDLSSMCCCGSNGKKDRERRRDRALTQTALRRKFILAEVYEDQSGTEGIISPYFAEFTHVGFYNMTIMTKKSRTARWALVSSWTAYPLTKRIIISARSSCSCDD